MADFVPKIEYGSSPTTVEFDLPPEGRDPLGRQVKLQGTVSKSSAGLTQTSIDYLEELFKMKFYDLDVSKVAELETFFTTHALQGNAFSYFPDKDSASFELVTLETRIFKPQGEFADGCNSDFKYTLEMEMRKVYS